MSSSHPNRDGLYDDVVGIGATYAGDLCEGATTGDEGKGGRSVVREEPWMGDGVRREGGFGVDLPSGLVSLPVEDYRISGD